MNAFARCACCLLSAISVLAAFAGCQAENVPQEPQMDHQSTEPPDALVTIPFMELPEAEQSDLPVLSIVTEDGLPITSKTQYKAASLSVGNQENAFFDLEVTMQIRGRGHSSFSADASQDDYKSKNSYRLKLDRAVNLLGVGKTKDRDWVLISGKFDASALRNYLVWDLAARMGSIPYVPSCTWVNLWVNGDYRGMYTLVEQIEVESDRVNIDDSPATDADAVGYLLEYDLRGAAQAGAARDLTYFYLPGADTEHEWVIKSRVHDVQTTAAIRTHLMACNDAILSGDRMRMEQYVDMASFVDMFILQELSKNVDVGCASFYVQRSPGGKLCLTAPWDFDFAFGTYRDSVSYDGLIADGEGVASHPWFEFLATQPWFMRLVLERMEQVEPMLRKTLEKLMQMIPKLKKAADQNDERWHIYGEKFSIYPSDQVSVDLESYPEHVEFLINWTQKRWKSLRKEVKKRVE